MYIFFVDLQFSLYQIKTHQQNVRIFQTINYNSAVVSLLLYFGVRVDFSLLFFLWIMYGALNLSSRNKIGNILWVFHVNYFECDWTPFMNTLVQRIAQRFPNIW